MLLIDRIGRKPLALIGSAGMAVSLALAAWAFSYKTGSGGNLSIPDTQGTVALIAAHAFVFFFAVSWGVVLWVMVGEMFPLQDPRRRPVRGHLRAVDRQLGHHRELPAHVGLEPVGHLRHLRGFAVLSFGFISRFVRETNGKELADWAEQPYQGSGVWVMGPRWTRSTTPPCERQATARTHAMA